MKRYLRALPIFCILIGTLFLLTACASLGPLPEGFSEEDVTAIAVDTVTKLSSEKYDEVCERFSPVMNIGADQLKNAVGARIEKVGPLEEVLSTTVGGSSHKDIGDYAVVILDCRHTDGRSYFTVSIDRDGRICGLYMK